jgi:hypothetical protein
MKSAVAAATTPAKTTRSPSLTTNSLDAGSIEGPGVRLENADKIPSWVPKISE